MNVKMTSVFIKFEFHFRGSQLFFSTVIIKIYDPYL